MDNIGMFQRQSVLGNQIEMDMMLTVEENEALLRVGIAFQSMEARHRVSEALERNYERGWLNFHSDQMNPNLFFEN